jgi:DNA-binding response OmpR family regulator
MKVLIVEDQTNLAEVIASRLKRDGLQADIAADGEQGLNLALRGIYDCIILDVMLPEKNGFEVLNVLKKNNVPSKVILLTAKTALEDKLRGLSAGADDYVTKPFHLEELAARVQVQLRKSGTGGIEAGDLFLASDSNRLECKSSGKAVELSARELALLEYFMLHPGQILTREQLYERVWGFDGETASNGLEAYLSFLRRKLKSIGSSSSLKAVRGLGYRLEDGNV